MINARFNDEYLWLTDDGWKNLKDLLKPGDKIEIIGIGESDD